jgi:PPK2 family polyphosphate:nucleotide phosphotransferase
MKKKAREEMDRLIVPPGRKISLAKDYDPRFTGRIVEKKEATGLLQRGVKLLAELQDMLYAQDRHALLVVLQAMDAAGKDGTIKHVMSGVNPQGVQVYSFKGPSAEEMDHDYLWRSMKALPERGRIGIFNRSYYEEVLVVRVHPEILDGQKLPEDKKGKGIWKRRFDEINHFEKYLEDNGIHVVKIFLNVSRSEQKKRFRDIRGFERYLAENGVRIVKFFLHVSRDEQKKRFLERIEEPEKNWKFSAADVRERAHWNDYMKAYEDVFNHTSTAWAPWHIIPADHKWYTRIAVVAVIVRKLQSLGLHYPVVGNAARKELLEARRMLLKEK